MCGCNHILESFYPKACITVLQGVQYHLKLFPFSTDVKSVKNKIIKTVLKDFIPFIDNHVRINA